MLRPALGSIAPGLSVVVGLAALLPACDMEPYVAARGLCTSVEADLRSNRGWVPAGLGSGSDGQCLLLSGGWYAADEGGVALSEPLVGLNLYTEDHHRLRLYLRPSSFSEPEEDLEVIDFPPELWGERETAAEVGQAFGRINYDGYTSTDFDLAMLGPDLEGPISEVRIQNAEWATAPGEEGRFTLQLHSVDFVDVGSESIAALSGNVELEGTIEVVYEAESLE